MKTLLKVSLAFALAAGLFVPSAHAAPRSLPTTSNVPEIDPSMGAGALALIAGAAMVVRSRRKV